MTIGFFGFGARQAIELQMIVRIDQARQHAIAIEVEDRIVGIGIRAHGGDARADDAQAGDFAAAQLSVDQGDTGRRGHHFRARTISTIGRPSHRR